MFSTKKPQPTKPKTLEAEDNWLFKAAARIGWLAAEK